MKELLITKKDGSVIAAERGSPLLETVNVHDIESLEWREKKEYEPHFDFRPNHNYKKV
jgi:hypothetical protein